MTHWKLHPKYREKRRQNNGIYIERETEFWKRQIREHIKITKRGRGEIEMRVGLGCTAAVKHLWTTCSVLGCSDDWGELEVLVKDKYSTLSSFENLFSLFAFFYHASFLLSFLLFTLELYSKF